MVDRRIRTSADSYRYAGRHGDTRIELVEGATLTVASHPAGLAWALAKILVNAEDAGVSLILQIIMSAREHKSHIVIAVQDTGVQSFFRGRALIAESCYSTISEHDGLGLYISPALIEHNGGCLVLERDVKGARVVTTLTLAES